MLPSVPRVFSKDTLIKGQPATIDCVEIAGQTYSISRGNVSVVRLEDEWYEDVDDPNGVLAVLREHNGLSADLFTFWQRLPELDPKYPFQRCWDEIAVLRVHSYEFWLRNQVKARTRNLIRKAEREGVVVREASYDADFVRGMTTIFNEAAVRRGRRFWHYGKDVPTVQRQFSRYVHREYMIGAYYRDAMIGFMMLGNAGPFAIVEQSISSIHHRDKATNNALMAKAVEVCARLGLEHLVYLYWSHDSLSEFKRRCGFERTKVPRYHVPLTAKGQLALTVGVHRGWSAIVPPGMRFVLKSVRASWYASRERLRRR